MLEADPAKLGRFRQRLLQSPIDNRYEKQKVTPHALIGVGILPL
jgi:hypothetical protein